MYTTISSILQYLGIKEIKKNNKYGGTYRDDKYNIHIYGEASKVVMYKGLSGIGIAYSHDYAKNHEATIAQMLDIIKNAMIQDGLIK